MSVPLNRQCNHEENRLKICAPCGRKIIFGNKKVQFFKINEKKETLIQKLIDDKFSLANEKYPKSICRTCSHTLSEHDKNIFGRRLPHMPKYHRISITAQTRASVGKLCDCYICQTARWKGHESVLRGTGKHRECTAVDRSNDLYGSLHNRKVGDGHKKKLSSYGNSIKKCTKCFTEISRGKNHKCIEDPRSKTIRKNIMKDVSKLPSVDQERIVSSILQNIIPSESKGNKNVELILSSEGRPTKILIHPDIKPETCISAESLDHFQVCKYFVEK